MNSFISSSKLGVIYCTSSEFIEPPSPQDRELKTTTPELRAAFRISHLQRLKQRTVDGEQWFGGVCARTDIG